MAKKLNLEKHTKGLYQPFPCPPHKWHLQLLTTLTTSFKYLWQFFYFFFSFFLNFRKGFFLLSQIILCSDLRSFHQLRLFLRYLFLHWQDRTRQDRRSHSYFQLCLYDRGWDRRTHLAKCPSDLKQNGTQENTPFSATVFHTLSHGVLRFVASVSSKKLTGLNF